MDILHREAPTSYPKLIDKRLQQIRFAIEDLKLDGLVVSYLPNIRYLTNFSGSSAYLFILPNEIHFITDDRYEYQIKGELFPIKNMKIHITREVWKYIAENNILGPKTKTLGFEADKVFYSEAVEIRNLIRPLKFKPTPGEIEPFTMPKDPEELKNIQDACKMCEDVYEYIKTKIKPGLTEWDITNQIAYKARELGSEGVPFHIICTSGTNTAMAHLHPTMRKIKKGDLILMEFGCTVNGFASTLCRTLAVGSATKEQETMYTMLVEAQNATFKNLRQGIVGKVLESYARKIINEGGYGEYFKTNLGHGVGITYNEKPMINSRSEDIVPEGCVMAIEPGVYIPNKFGMRIKDTAKVNKDGVQQITFPPEKLEII
jgi:Xaa-Pro aminopeptidase